MNVLMHQREAATLAGNTLLANKWLREHRMMCKPEAVGALRALNLNEGVFDGLAIYAAQKVRRMLLAFAGLGRPDPFTVMVVRNALLSSSPGDLTSRQIACCLSDQVSLPEDETLLKRRAGHASTATSQASAVKAALVAIGAARVEQKGREKHLHVLPDHPVVLTLMGAK